MKKLCKKIILAAQLLLIALISFSNAVAQPGAIDPTFNGSAFNQPAGNVRDTALQADGKILAVGNFEIVSGFLRNSVVRLNADGTVDAAFNPPEFDGASFGNLIQAVELQSSGKIIVAGNFTMVNGRLVNAPIVRLNGDGSLDNSFALSVVAPMGFNGAILDIAVLPDDKILIGGSFSYFPPGGSSTEEEIARLNPNGTTDLTFAAANNYQTFYDIEVQPDGKILGAVFLSGNNYFLKRLNTDGTEDTSFNALTNGTLHYAFEVQADGKILIGGFFSAVNNFPRTQIARLNADASLDQTFTASSDGNGVFDIEIGVEGKILVGGRFNSFNGSPKARVVRLNGDGTIDDSLNFINPTAPTETRISELQDILPLPDGRVIVSGVGFRSGSQLGGLVFRLDASGAIDQTFQVQIGTRGTIGDIAVQPDGKILVAGVFSTASGAVRVSLARFNADGSADTTFDAGFFNPSADPIVFAVTLQPDGKILVGGRFGLIRLNADGSNDTSFNSNVGSSFIYDVALQPDGKIIAVGSFQVSGGFVRNIARFNENGALDTSFQSLVGSEARKVVIQPDGKLVIGGAFTTINGFSRGRVARLNADGTVDTAFNPLGGANDTVQDLDVQADGKVIIGGFFTNVNGTAKNYLARLNVDGTLDTAFNPSVNANLAAVKIQTDGKILIGGNFGIVNGAARNGVARLNADGSLDSSFNVGAGTNGSVYTLAIQPDNRILVGGIFTRYNNIPKLAIVRLLNNSLAVRTQFDFDGDRRADIALFRPSNGFWYILPGQTNAFYGFPFGQSGDQIAPADFDGDGRTDIAVWRGTVSGAGISAYFYITNSADNTFRAVQFGATGDVPVSGDWDGDGKGDLAVYREGASGGQSFFYYRPSSQPGVNFNTIALGMAGDKPLVGDFDGDGKLDAAVFRASTATWIILRGSDGVTTQTNFGLSTDIPTPADFDGDGTANIAVFRPSNGTWFTSTNPANNYGAIQFGASGDVPVAADYDGDGRADVAVFRPSNGAWYLNRSTQGFTGVSFGSAEDKPIPNAYIR